MTENIFLVTFEPGVGKQGHGNQSGESQRPLTLVLLENIAIHLPFLSQYFCKSMPSSWQKAVYTPPICITIRLPFVSRYFCRSIRVRDRWNTLKSTPYRRYGLNTEIQSSPAYTWMPRTCTENSASTPWSVQISRKEKSRYGRPVSTPHRRYENDCGRCLVNCPGAQESLQILANFKKHSAKPKMAALPLRGL